MPILSKEHLEAFKQLREGITTSDTEEEGEAPSKKKTTRKKRTRKKKVVKGDTTYREPSAELDTEDADTLREIRDARKKARDAANKRKRKRAKEVQGTPTMPFEVREELAKQQEAKIREMAMVVMGDEELQQIDPFKTLMYEMEKQRELFVQSRIHDILKKELTVGPMSSRSRSGLGNLIPPLEEMTSTSGEWEDAWFKGQAGLAMGTTDTQKYIRESILGMLSMSPAMRSKSGKSETLYKQLRKRLFRGLNVLGGSMQGILGGIDPETSSLSLGVMTNQEATQENVDALKEFNDDLRAYIEMMKGTPQYTRFFDAIMGTARGRDIGDDESWQLLSEALNLDDWSKSRLPVKVRGMIHDPSGLGKDL
jgi:hypothetical protein